MLLKQSTARNRMVFMNSSTDHVSGLAGLTLSINASKNGASFAGITPTVSDRGSGWYSLALDATMTDTLGDFALHITASGADPADLVDQVVVDLPGGAVSGGLDAAGVRAAVGLASANLDAQLSTIDDFLDTEIAAIDTTVIAIKARTDLISATMNVNVTEIDGDSNAATYLRSGVKGNITGVVATGSDTTHIVSASLNPSPTIADQFKNRILTFAYDTLTPELQGHCVEISASSDDGILTVSTMVAIPASGDTFCIT